MNNKLLQLKEENKIVSCYLDTSNTSKFIAGFVNEISDNYIILNSVSPTGLYDGFMLIDLEKIYRIEYDTEYERKLYKLYQLKNNNAKNFKNTKSNLLFSIIQFAKENKLVLTIELCDSELDDICGMVDEVEDNQLKISCINEYGIKIGTSIIELDKITFIIVDSDKEQDINLLYNNQD